MVFSFQYLVTVYIVCSDVKVITLIALPGQDVFWESIPQLPFSKLNRLGYDSNQAIMYIFHDIVKL